MTDIKDRAREYLRGQTQLNGGGLFHCNILNLVLGFAEQEIKELDKENIELVKENTELKEQNIKDCKNFNKTMKETKEQWNKEHYQLAKARKHLKDLVYVVELGKNELATARILAEAKEFLKEE